MKVRSTWISVDLIVRLVILTRKMTQSGWKCQPGGTEKGQRVNVLKRESIFLGNTRDCDCRDFSIG